MKFWFSNGKRQIAFLLAAGCLIAARYYAEEKEQRQDPVRIWREKGMAAVREQVEGFVVFERLGKEHRGIWIQTLGEGKPEPLVKNGRFPRISPDGTTVYYLRGDNTVCRIPVSGGRSEVLLKWMERIPAISLHPVRNDLFFVSQSGLWKINTRNREVARVEPLPEHGAAVDVDKHSNFVISTYEGRRHRMWKQHAEQIMTDQWEKMDEGCSAAISPDGRFFTDNHNLHTRIEIKSFATNELLHKARTFPEIYGVDNEAWTNLDDWVVFNSETRDARFVWLYRLGRPPAFKCTFTWDSDRPDAYITRVHRGERLTEKL